MLKVEFLENKFLSVKEMIHSFVGTEVSFCYYDLDNRLKSCLGKEGETPSMAMSEADFSWVQKHYIPLAAKQKAEKDAQAEANRIDPWSVNPQRFEAARRWSFLATASLVKDGSYETMTREEIMIERNVRYDALKATLRIPTDQEISVARKIISDHEPNSNTSDQNSQRMRA